MYNNNTMNKKIVQQMIHKMKSRVMYDNHIIIIIIMVDDEITGVAVVVAMEIVVTMIECDNLNQHPDDNGPAIVSIRQLSYHYVVIT